MGVEQSAHIPLAGKGITPGQDIGKKVGTDLYWQNKAQEARAMREYEEEKKNIEALRSPPAAQEPPIKMSGSINLGHIDFQEQANRAREAEQQARVAAEERTKRLEAENEKLKTDLLATTINNLQTNLGGQIQKLQADIATGRGNARSIADQLKEVIDSAALLGYVRPELTPKSPVVQNTTDAAISLEMLRLQLEDKRTERSFAWQMEKDRRQFSLELKKLDQANRLAIAESSSRKERDQILYQFPEMIGNTIAKGLLAPRDGVAARPNPVQRRPPANAYHSQPSEHIESQPPVPSSDRRVTAGPGEAGTIDCPECGSPIAIGPTATRAICASCEYTVDVVRQGAENGA
jgi:hypothetical protein